MAFGCFVLRPLRGVEVSPRCIYPKDRTARFSKNAKWFFTDNDLIHLCLFSTQPSAWRRVGLIFTCPSTTSLQKQEQGLALETCFIVLIVLCCLCIRPCVESRNEPSIYFLCQAVLRGCLLTCTEFMLAVTTGVAKDSLNIKECWQSILVVYCMYFSLSSLKQPSKKPSSLCWTDGVPLSSGLPASGACLRRVCSPFPYGITSLHLNLPLWTFLIGWCFGRQNVAL